MVAAAVDDVELELPRCDQLPAATGLEVQEAGRSLVLVVGADVLPQEHYVAMGYVSEFSSL